MERTYTQGQRLSLLSIGTTGVLMTTISDGWLLTFAGGAQRLMDKRGVLHDDTPAGRAALTRVGPSFRAGGQRVYSEAEIEKYAAPEAVLRHMQVSGLTCTPEAVLAEYFTARRLLTEGDLLWQAPDPDGLMALFNPDDQPFRQVFELRRDATEWTLLVGEERIPRLVMTVDSAGLVSHVRTDFAL
ncbi:hypothetical protein [Deinococcus soli (ex Cha et al. 2016)]|uniref:Uncharacterized protein n=2 Tax=Deinococcus soli (ex Cha et al. 2016) TaxID=1309411 RepID=A0AAE4BN46_9DEIO|nr:hypothetical protein [Deinococcus soli (ex Cha et al. 2016)]MDR6218346.1 hypothetical protein [Deinococcus soli (ex Cha et al. 2016)]MDR6329086.1 hypothetical protein [Deinococcus soli (ex Cha et al. 2016)]MDR6751359.1 hypothetical protein [Deinococcus soli (ex Cha et al. 2016)]